MIGQKWLSSILLRHTAFLLLISLYSMTRTFPHLSSLLPLEIILEVFPSLAILHFTTTTSPLTNHIFSPLQAFTTVSPSAIYFPTLLLHAHCALQLISNTRPRLFILPKTFVVGEVRSMNCARAGCLQIIELVIDGRLERYVTGGNRRIRGRRRGMEEGRYEPFGNFHPCCLAILGKKG